MDLIENCLDRLPIFDWCKRLEFLKGASASLCLSIRKFSKTLLLSSTQIIRIRTILLSSLNILGRGQTTIFLPILAQQQPAATAAPTIFDRQSRRIEEEREGRSKVEGSRSEYSPVRLFAQT
ncbi:unnamed protein product, partial [Prunus brigantina]